MMYGHSFAKEMQLYTDFVQYEILFAVSIIIYFYTYIRSLVCHCSCEKTEIWHAARAQTHLDTLC